MPDITSRPFRPDPAKACEACCFGRGRHAEFCKLITDTDWVEIGRQMGDVWWEKTQAQARLSCLLAEGLRPRPDAPFVLIDGFVAPV